MFTHRSGHSWSQISSPRFLGGQLAKPLAPGAGEARGAVVAVSEYALACGTGRDVAFSNVATDTWGPENVHISAVVV